MVALFVSTRQDSPHSTQSSLPVLPSDIGMSLLDNTVPVVPSTLHSLVGAPSQLKA